MRTIVNISMPEQLRLYMVKRARESNFGTVSEYVRDLVRKDQDAYHAEIHQAIERQRSHDRDLHDRHYRELRRRTFD